MIFQTFRAWRGRHPHGHGCRRTVGALTRRDTEKAQRRQQPRRRAGSEGRSTELDRRRGACTLDAGRLTPAPTDSATLTFLTMTTKPRLRAEFKAGEGGKAAVSMARGITTHSDKGAWGEVPTATAATQANPPLYLLPAPESSLAAFAVRDVAARACPL